MTERLDPDSLRRAEPVPPPAKPERSYKILYDLFFIVLAAEFGIDGASVAMAWVYAKEFAPDDVNTQALSVIGALVLCIFEAARIPCAFALRTETSARIKAACVAGILVSAPITRRINAQSGLLELTGWSLVVAASGGAIWAGCLGLAKYKGDNAKLQEAEGALIERVANALANAPLKVEVVAKLADGSQVRLAPDGKVTLAKDQFVRVSPDSTVGLDPQHSTVRVAAQAPEPPRPTPAQIQAEARPASGAPVMTNVVVFHKAAFGKGEVHSGWEYSDSAQSRPSNQYCVYREALDSGTETITTIGLNGNMTLPDRAPAGVDLRAAFQSCVWWNATAKAPAEKPNKAAPPPSHVISVKAQKG